MKTIITPIPGQFHETEGGIFAGVMHQQNTLYGLIISPKAEGEAESLNWGTYGQRTEKTDCYWNGQENTAAQVKTSQECPAANFASALNINGFTDWYLPAQKELNLCYINAQNEFAKTWYWSSTQSSAYSAWIQDFYDGFQFDGSKDHTHRVRAVRRFLINSTL